MTRAMRSSIRSRRASDTRHDGLESRTRFQLGDFISFRHGVAKQTNLDSYAPIRMNEFPRQININHIKTDRRISGIGEEAVPLVALAIFERDPYGDRQTHSVSPIARPRLELHSE